jgi:zinc-binding in reverse transcriptase
MTLIALWNRQELICPAEESSTLLNLSRMYSPLQAISTHNFFRYDEPRRLRRSKIFSLLLPMRRLLTHDVMEWKHIYCDMACIMCTICQTETTIHLFFSCAYAQQVWRALNTHYNRRLLRGAGDIQIIATAFRKHARIMGVRSVSQWWSSLPGNLLDDMEGT